VSTYAIDGGRSGRERLRVLWRVLGAATCEHLARVGVPPDARVLDVGCGGGDLSLALAGLAPRGHVVGVDADAACLALARAEAASAGVGNVTYVERDVTARWPDEEPYDVVVARFLLCHLADPDAVLGRIVAATRPGGRVVLEDTHIGGSVCWPPDPVFTRSLALYSATVRARGGDPDIGLRLPAMLAAAGVDDVAVSLAQPLGLRGEAKRIQALTLERVGAAAVAAGLASPDEVAEIVAGLEALVDRPDVLVSTARVVQVHGRRPI
jgi:SAM-dependent methyltransferase